MSNKNLTWNELEAEIFTPEEIAESHARVEIIASIIDARQAKGLSQKELAEITGIKQPAIARLENGHISPSVDTINKLLAPLGKRLAVIDLFPDDTAEFLMQTFCGQYWQIRMSSAQRAGGCLSGILPDTR